MTSTSRVIYNVVVLINKLKAQKEGGQRITPGNKITQAIKTGGRRYLMEQQREGGQLLTEFVTDETVRTPLGQNWIIARVLAKKVEMQLGPDMMTTVLVPDEDDPQFGEYVEQEVYRWRQIFDMHLKMGYWEIAEDGKVILSEKSKVRERVITDQMMEEIISKRTTVAVAYT